MENFKFYDYQINNNEGLIVNTDCNRYNVENNEGCEEVTWLRNDYETIELDFDDTGIKVEFVKTNGDINIWKDEKNIYYTSIFDERNEYHIVSKKGELEEYEVVLELQLVDAIDYQNGVRFDLEEVIKVQENAINEIIDFCNNSNINFISNGDFNGSTSLNDGYTETVPFTIETLLNGTELKKELKRLKDQIDYGYDIYTIEH